MGVLSPTGNPECQERRGERTMQDLGLGTNPCFFFSHQITLYGIGNTEYKDYMTLPQLKTIQKGAQSLSSEFDLYLCFGSYRHWRI